MPVPGWRLRISLQASMPSRSKFGGMRMSLTTTSGCASLGAGDEPVVVLGHADDLDVGVALRAWRSTPSRMMTLSSARKTVMATTMLNSNQNGGLPPKGATRRLGRVVTATPRRGLPPHLAALQPVGAHDGA